MRVKFLDELESLIKKFSIQTDDICIAGSAVFAYEDIRGNGDLDIVIRPEVRKKILEEYREQIEVLPTGTINAGNIQSAYNRYKKVGIEDGQIFCTKYTVRRGKFLVVRPELELAQKIKRGREKDKLDLKNIGFLFFENPDFDMDLFKRLLSTQDTVRRSYADIVKKMILHPGVILDYIKIICGKYSGKKKNETKSISQIEGEYVMPVGALLHRGYSLEGFRRYDILLISYLLSCEQKTDELIKLSCQVADERKIALAEKNLKEKRSLNRFYEVGVDENGVPGYDSIELCQAICERKSWVKIKNERDKKELNYSLEWLRNYNAELAVKVENYKKSIFKEYGIYFCAIIWGAAKDYTKEIEVEIEEKFSILDRKYITFKENDYYSFIREIYDIDDVEAWKIAIKAERLKEYEHSAEAIIFEVPFPNFRRKERDGSYISDEGVKLKKEIREKYKGNIPNYQNDVIIHIGDNHKHNAEMIKIVEKYMR